MARAHRQTGTKSAERLERGRLFIETHFPESPAEKAARYRLIAREELLPQFYYWPKHRVEDRIEWKVKDHGMHAFRAKMVFSERTGINREVMDYFRKFSQGLKSERPEMLVAIMSELSKALREKKELLERKQQRIPRAEERLARLEREKKVYKGDLDYFKFSLEKRKAMFKTQIYIADALIKSIEGLVAAEETAHQKL